MQAGFVVVVAARPTAAVGAVAHELEVADGVVFVALGVVAQRLQVVGMRAAARRMG